MSYLPYAYFDGDYVAFSDAKVSVATHALQYGTGVFGGIRGYLSHDEKTINIFRLPDHCERVIQSAGLVKIQLPFDTEGLAEIFVELTKRNAPKGNVYYRPFAYKAGFDLTPKLTNVDDGFTLYMMALEDYYGADEGLSAMVSAWRRVNDNMIPARGKVSGAYINSSLAKDDALAYGFDEAIMLNELGKVGEGSAANLMMVRKGVLVTPPITADILEGITRRTMFQIATDLGIEIEQRSIDRTELYIADELFFCGTGAQVTPIGSVDRRPVGDGKAGKITRAIAERFHAIVRGKVTEYEQWLTKVPVV
ncbi:MAG: branched-chain amino acid transaminase [Trueperaceae bacterium]|nr:branched-chain amino acid transaminase [Trueperaceae bacterium]